MDEKRIGERIAALRTEANLTQAALAEALDVSDKTVSKWETGGGYPDITMFPRLAEIFHVSRDYRIRGTLRKIQNLAAKICLSEKLWRARYRQDQGCLGTGVEAPFIVAFRFRRKRICHGGP